MMLSVSNPNWNPNIGEISTSGKPVKNQWLNILLSTNNANGCDEIIRLHNHQQIND